MGGLAHQHHAVLAGNIDGERREQEHMRRRQQLDDAEQPLRLLAEQRGQLLLAALLRRLERVALIDPHQIGAVAAGGDQRERAVLIMELDGGAADRALEPEVADQRRLGETVLAGPETGALRFAIMRCSS